MSKKTAVLILLMLSAAISGVVFANIDHLGLKTHSFSFVFNIITGFLVFSWCAFDAQDRKTRFGRALSIAMVLVSSIGFAIYCFRSRGFKGVFLLGLGFLFAVLFLIVFVIAFAVTYSVIDPGADVFGLI